MRVFEVDEILCFKFHIDLNLSENKRKEYSAKLIKNGGEVIPLPSDDVLTLTTKKFRDVFSYEVYDIKFIDDCIEAGKVLDIGKYGLSGIQDYGCPMSLLLFGEKDCPVVEILRYRHSVPDTSSSNHPSPSTSPSLSAAQRVEPVEENQILRNLEPELIKTPKKKQPAEILENYTTPKKTRNILASPTVVKSLEKRGVSILRSSEKKSENGKEKKRVKISLSLPVKNKEEINKTSRRKESESRIDENDEDFQEVDVNALVKQVTQSRKEKEKRELERIEKEAKEKERREEEERRKELERMEEARREQERRDELEREKQEIMEKWEREKREFQKELERKEEELKKREKELEERLEQERKAKKKEPLITKVVKIVLDRSIDSGSQTLKEITCGKRFLSSFDSEESQRECKRPKNQETQSQEMGDSQSSMEQSSNLHESSDSTEISSADMRPFTQIPSVSTQHSTTDSSEAISGSYEYQDDDFENRAQFDNERQQIESGDMDCSEGYKVAGATQNILDDLEMTVESLGNHQEVSDEENAETSLEKIGEIQEKIVEVEEKMRDSLGILTDDESSPLLDDASKAALLQDDSETDFESANDTPPNVNNNLDPDVIIVENNTSGDNNFPDKSPIDTISIKRERDKSLENNEDDYDDISDAETIKLSQIRGRPDLIPKPREKKKEAKKKGKLVGLKHLFQGETQEQADSFEEPRKELDENEEKENVGKSGQSKNTSAKSRWAFLFP
ncbi:trichohyalin-like [Belonocnema kinseyi]|uniref:trichohyalin-like n=1 Tax=Belonocnema kinseyi TaxID=2817044 RepID=UPI00143D8305|nr:trichohyalin-like [Belonocnema kinseyi]